MERPMTDRPTPGALSEHRVDGLRSHHGLKPGIKLFGQPFNAVRRRQSGPPGTASIRYQPQIQFPEDTAIAREVLTAGLMAPAQKNYRTALPPSCQVSTRSAVSGALRSTRNTAHAAPVGQRLPGSRYRIVSCGTSSRRANSVWVRPSRRWILRAYRAMACIAFFSSSCSCAAITASVGPGGSDGKSGDHRPGIRNVHVN